MRNNRRRDITACESVLTLRVCCASASVHISAGDALEMRLASLQPLLHASCPSPHSDRPVSTVSTVARTARWQLYSNTRAAFVDAAIVLLALLIFSVTLLQISHKRADSSVIGTNPAASTSAVASRHLLSTDLPAHHPFASETQRRDLLSQWEREFRESVQRVGAFRAFVSMLAPAVDHLPVHAAPLDSTDFCIVALENTESSDLVFTLKHTFHMLGMSSPAHPPGSRELHVTPRWSLILFVTPEVEPFYVRQLQVGVGLPGEHVKLIRVSPLGARQRETLLSSSMFYKHIPCEHILLLTAEGLMVRSPQHALPGTIHDDGREGESLTELLRNHVYIAAPWDWCQSDWCMVGGAGGLSARRRSAMLDLVQMVQCSDARCVWSDVYAQQEQSTSGFDQVEDTFIARLLHERLHKYGPSLPSRDTATHFSLGSVASRLGADARPWFVHRAWETQDVDAWAGILSRVKMYYPQLWRTS